MSTTMQHTLTGQSFTLSNGNTADTVRVSIVYNHPERTATIEAWPEMHERDDAERIDLLASAVLTQDRQEPSSAYRQRVETEAATMGMDTLREWSRPLLREPDTRGDW